MPQVVRGLLVLCLLALAACGLGTEEQTGSAEISEAGLAIMVLPQQQLGPEVRGFEVDEDSGPTSNKESAHDSVDPEDTAASLLAKGRLAGYDLSYTTRRSSRAIKRRKGFITIGSAVELLRDEIYAAQYLDKQADDFERLEGTVEDGVKLAATSTFSVAGVGDEARGVRATLAVAGIKLHLTTAGFRRGRLVASVGILRADRRNEAAKVRELAAALDARIQGVLAGEIIGEPVPLPRKAPKARKSQKSLDPRPLTLRAEDFAGGTSVIAQDYRRNGDVRSFLREFAVAGGTLGGSTVSYVRGMTQIMDSPSSADFLLGYAGTFEGSRELADTFIRRVLNLKPRNLLAGPLPTRRRNAAAVVFSFDTPRGRTATVVVYVRSGRALGSLTAVGRGNELNPSDVIAFAGKIRARLNAR